MINRTPWLPLGLAFLFTLFNAIKPLTIDDTAYSYYAAQVARAPLDPYGFSMFWYEEPEPAQEILAPLAVPYWWAVAIRLFGDRPFWWKLWLLPFSLLFVFSLHTLFRRWARGLERPLLVMTVLSPTFLPSLNLMLDIPALSLGLFGLTAFVRAVDRGSLPLAVLAGLVGGLAMQTKYTGFLAPATIVVYACLHRQWILGLAAGLLSAGVFAGWETFLHYRYGTSHFLFHARQSSGGWLGKVQLAMPLLTVVGAVAPYLAMLGFAAFRVSGKVINGAGLLFLLGYAVVAAVPAAWATIVPATQQMPEPVTVPRVVYWLFGFAVFVLISMAAWLQCRRRKGKPPGTNRAKVWANRFWFGPTDGLFLTLWLGLEVLGYFALSPAPAVRRVMGIIVVSTLLVGRLASRTCRPAQRRRQVWAITAFAVFLGLGYYGIDLRDAFAEKDAVERSARQIAQEEPGATVWYVGHWGFQFYAERAGMQPVVPGRSLLRRGDWLVVPDSRLEQQRIRIDPERFEPAGPTVRVEDPIPFRTIMGYYWGVEPLEHHEGPRVTVTIYRAVAEVVPAGPNDP